MLLPLHRLVLGEALRLAEQLQNSRTVASGLASAKVDALCDAAQHLHDGVAVLLRGNCVLTAITALGALAVK